MAAVSSTSTSISHSKLKSASEEEELVIELMESLDLVNKQISIRSNDFLSFRSIPLGNSRYQPWRHGIVDIYNRNGYQRGIPMYRVCFDEEEREDDKRGWFELRKYIFYIEGCELMFRNGKPISYHLDWWKQPPQRQPSIQMQSRIQAQLQQHTITSTPASTSFNPSIRCQRVHPILDLLLHGTISSTSPFRHLRGLTSTLLRIIWYWYLSLITHWRYNDSAIISRPISNIPYIIHTPHRQQSQFPSPKGIHICNMPFIPSDLTSYPNEIFSYVHLLTSIFHIHEYHGIAYLTIYEKQVKKGDIVRMDDGSYDIHVASTSTISSLNNHIESFSSHTHRGIYLASNLDDTCMISKYHLIDPYLMTYDGSLHFIRSFIPKHPILLEAHHMYYIHPHTPHQYIPIHITHDGWFQWIRIITYPISIWDAQSNTSNPLGILPDVPIRH